MSYTFYTGSFTVIAYYAIRYYQNMIILWVSLHIYISKLMQGVKIKLMILNKSWLVADKSYAAEKQDLEALRSVLLYHEQVLWLSIC